MNSTQKDKNAIPDKGKTLPAKEGVNKAITDFLKQSLEKKCFEAILVPVKVLDTESYAWVLLKDESILDQADPLPPVMTVQGGRALSSLTKHGEIKHKVAAVMRPCEIRAAVELFKLKQINLDNITLISMDCPGAMPLSGYMADPEKTKNTFTKIMEKWEENDSLRPVCQICQRFSLPSHLPPSPPLSSADQNDPDSSASDLHIGLLGGDMKQIFLIPASAKGTELLEKLDLSPQDSLKNWESKVKEIIEKKIKKRETFNKKWLAEIKGMSKFIEAFDECLNCHNCMRVCPICYCQQCYFDSQTLKLTPDEYFQRAEKRGALRFPLDTLFFHLGRMSHMVLSCVSCGACEDACPMSIPVAQIFTAVGDQTQKDFNYVPGRNKEESLPLQFYLEDEFCEVEVPSECEETAIGEAK
ncbi:MAG: 4Fe-4S dicluster domain-containing protein [Candidatus Aminicenantes bacterium]|nr:4Fe-4S dicluster domain-containing protein [Candidatus Aminicenantes bacterium]